MLSQVLGAQPWVLASQLFLAVSFGKHWTWPFPKASKKVLRFYIQKGNLHLLGICLLSGPWHHSQLSQCCSRLAFTIPIFQREYLRLAPSLAAVTPWSCGWLSWHGAQSLSSLASHVLLSPWLVFMLPEPLDSFTIPPKPTFHGLLTFSWGTTSGM